MKNKLFYMILLTVTVAASCLSSCVSPKDVVYLQDAERGKLEPLNVNYQTTIQKDDQLVITVSSKQPELTQPFTVSELGNGGNSSTTGGRNYQVDANGNIVLPVIGTVHASGLTCSKLAANIADKLRRMEYIKDASVNVRIINFKYSVLGEVKSPGTKTVDGERVTILEALSQAGDLNDTADRTVTVLREKNGQRELATVDLRSKALFSSPFYYIQQNDVIYVTKSSQSFNMLRSDSSQWWTLGIGGVGFMIGIIALIAA